MEAKACFTLTKFRTGVTGVEPPLDIGVLEVTVVVVVVVVEDEAAAALDVVLEAEVSVDGSSSVVEGGDLASMTGEVSEGGVPSLAWIGTTF